MSTGQVTAESEEHCGRHCMYRMIPIALLLMAGGFQFLFSRSPYRFSIFIKLLEANSINFRMKIV
jgi:hypothetical protein